MPLLKILSTLLAACALCGAALADHPASTRIPFNIPQQPLADALTEWSRQSGLQVLRRERDAAELTSAQVAGEFSPAEALSRMLAKTGLKYEFVNEHTVRIAADDSSARIVPSSGIQPTLQLAQVADTPAEDTRSGAKQTNTTATRDKDQADFVVTGSRIKGVADQFSPVTSVDRNAMDLAGFTNVFDVVDSLPQNFGGGVSFDTSAANSFEGPGGAGVNLRGLGNQATLVLLNGRRLAPGGLIGDFVDISTIPASAIERVEVMTDGASAIYGSDAIAGVVNIILRKDFSGAESRLNVGTIDKGDGDLFKAGQTFGWAGDRGHALLTYEYSSEDPLDAKDKPFASPAADPTWLLPATRKNTFFASGGAALSERTSFSADGYYNARDTQSFTSTQDSYLFQSAQDQNVKQYGGATGLNVRLGGDWEADVSAAYSRNNRTGDVNFPTFNLRQLLRANAEMAAFDASSGGTVFHLAGHEVKGVFGAHYRTEEIHGRQSDFTTGVPVWTLDGKRHVSAAFGELYAPLITAADGRRGIHQLALTVAARYDNYSDVGSSFDPKFGVLWSPVAGLNLRGTYSTAFRAPRLEQLGDNIDSAALSVFVDPQSPGGTAVALDITGEKPDIDPEQAKTWTAGFDWTRGGFTVRATYFNIDYQDRVAEPFPGFDSQSRWVDFPGIPIRNPSLATVLDYVSRTPYFTNYSDYYPSLGTLRLQDVTVILDSRDQNLSASKADGFDLELSYDFASDSGDWNFFVNSTHLNSITQQFAPGALVEELIDTFNNPVGWKMRGGLSWRTEPATAALYVNYVDKYVDDLIVSEPHPIASWTTMDATLRLDLGKLTANTLTRGAALTFNVSNVFDRDPPAVGHALYRTTFYDPANSDPTGRRYGLLLTKQW